MTITPSVSLLTAAVAALLAASPLALAQTAAAGAKPAAAAKAAPKPAAKKKATPSASRTEIKSTAKNVAAGIEAAEDALTPAELEIASRVYVGKLPCELSNYVELVADPKTPGYFNVQGKTFKYRMFPVVTSTGAIRLEDRKAGAVWLQLANKSMLMNQKLGIRLADECASPAQVAVAESLKLNPQDSILDAPKKPVTAALPDASAVPTTGAATTATPPAAGASAATVTK